MTLMSSTFTNNTFRDMCQHYYIAFTDRQSGGGSRLVPSSSAIARTNNNHRLIIRRITIARQQCVCLCFVGARVIVPFQLAFGFLFGKARRSSGGWGKRPLKRQDSMNELTQFFDDDAARDDDMPHGECVA